MTLKSVMQMGEALLPAPRSSGSRRRRRRGCTILQVESELKGKLIPRGLREAVGGCTIVQVDHVAKSKKRIIPGSYGAAGEGGTALSMVIVHVEGESQRPN